MSRHLGTEVGNVFQLLEFLGIALDRNRVDKIALGLFASNPDAIDIFMITKPLDGSRGARDAVFGKRLGGLFDRQCMTRRVAT